jgi:putative phage-type endonuclease
MAIGRGAVSAFAEHCEWTGAAANDRDHWLMTRRSGVGGSDASAIMGVNDYASELAVYVEKTSVDPPDAESTEVARWGNIFEPSILREYARRSQRRVVSGGKLMRSLKASHHLVTLDGVQFNRAPSWARGPGVAEVKTTGYGNRYDEGIPVEVQIQIQWEMFVTGATWATCVMLPFPERKLQWFDVAPHPEFQAILAERVDAFWLRVLNRTPPDPDGSESSQLALRKLYPEDTGAVIQVTGACAIADEYERNKAALAVLTARQGLIRNMLSATIREAKYALLDDGRYWGTAFFPARENKCRHCAGVLSSQGSYRTYTLRDPRKKPFPAISETRAFLLQEADAGPGLAKALEASLSAATLAPAAPANTTTPEAASKGGGE